MKAVEEDKKKKSMWSWSNRVGIGWAWRQKCEIAGGGKALFIKAYSVKWYFSPQIKMLKHNKYTVHLTSSQAPHATQSPPSPAQSLFLLSSSLVSVLCASTKVHV